MCAIIFYILVNIIATIILYPYIDDVRCTCNGIDDQYVSHEISDVKYRGYYRIYFTYETTVSFTCGDDQHLLTKTSILPYNVTTPRTCYPEGYAFCYKKGSEFRCGEPFGMRKTLSGLQYLFLTIIFVYYWVASIYLF